MNNQISTATAQIDLSALSHNFNEITKLSPNTQILAVCKANGYGHGLVETAKALPNADAFGVARIAEAYALRTGGIVQPIVLLEGFFNASDLPHLVASKIETVVHCEEQLIALEQADLSDKIQVWLKVDTGMHRVGIDPEQINEFKKRLLNSTNVAPNIRLMTHFACADEIKNPMTQQQMARLLMHTKANDELSFANSAAIINYPQSHFDWIRPGLLLYGVSPNPPSTTANELCKQLIPTMTLKSRLIAVKKVKANESVGYGATWQTNQETTLGVIAIGYGDGYPRHAQNGTPVYINGRTVPLVGRVSMDMITVDLGSNSNDKNGDEVILWGKELSVAQVAHHANTIPYQLLCGLTARVELQYLSKSLS